MKRAGTASHSIVLREVLSVSVTLIPRREARLEPLFLGGTKMKFEYEAVPVDVR